MGFLITLICIIVAGVILAIVIDKCFWYDNTLLQAFAIVLIVVPLIVLLAFGVQNLAVDADRIEKTQEYEELMVYTEFVEKYAADDPGLHLIHKAKVMEWNRQYENYEAKRNHPYWGLLVYPNIYRDCSVIEFDSIIDN